MRDDEYQKLRRALEEQRDADLELIRAGYRAKLHALDMLREGPPGPDESAPSASRETQMAAETQSPSETETSTQHIVVYSVHEEIEKILPRLPDVFDKLDVVRVLGWEPRRATLHRALTALRAEKKIAIEAYSLGRHPAKYRKISSS